MTFTINRAAFIKELNTVQRAISSKTTIPILTGLKLVADDSGLTLTGSDADISIETLIHADNRTTSWRFKVRCHCVTCPLFQATSLNGCRKTT